jgi:anti-sigma factor RsiW
VNDEHVEEELLQRYFDGVLEEQSAAHVKQHLGLCASCGARHRALGRLSQAIGMAAEEHARGVDFEALFSRIERGIGEPLNASPIERAVSRRDRVEKRWRQFWMPAAGAIAAAAALLLFLRSLPPKELPRASAPAGGESGQGLASRATATNSEVEQVDFGGNAGTVFEIALADGISTPVVWIDDSEQSGE